jgi:hypothetical protein
VGVVGVVALRQPRLPVPPLVGVVALLAAPLEAGLAIGLAP